MNKPKDEWPIKITSIYEETNKSYQLDSKKIGKLRLMIPDSISILFTDVELRVSLIQEIILKIKDEANKSDIPVLVDKLIINTVMLPIAIIATLEALCNQIIYLERRWYSKIDYEEIIKMKFDYKLFTLIPRIAYADSLFKKEDIEKHFRQLYRLRNKIVHMKTTSDDGNYTIKLIAELIDTDWIMMISKMKLLLQECDKLLNPVTK